MKYHITLEETRRTTYEVDASSETEARKLFIEKGGKYVAEETDLQAIVGVEPAEIQD